MRAWCASSRQPCCATLPLRFCLSLIVFKGLAGESLSCSHTISRQMSLDEWAGLAAVPYVLYQGGDYAFRRLGDFIVRRGLQGAWTKWGRSQSRSHHHPRLHHGGSMYGRPRFRSYRQSYRRSAQFRPRGVYRRYRRSSGYSGRSTGRRFRVFQRRR